MSAPFITTPDLTISNDDAIAGASGFIRDECNWHIWPQETVTKKLPTPGGDVLVLPTLMLASVTSITVNGDTLDVSNVETYESGIVERTDYCHWPRWGSVTVEFVHGYTSIPPAIRAVCQSLAKRWPLSASPWSTRRMGSAQISIGAGTSMVPIGGVTAVERMVLDRYTLKPQP